MQEYCSFSRKETFMKSWYYTWENWKIHYYIKCLLCLHFLKRMNEYYVSTISNQLSPKSLSGGLRLNHFNPFNLF